MTAPQSNALSSPPIITIDGPSGAGKGTLSFRLAEHFGVGLLDSGALYRIVGLLAYQHGLLNDESGGEINEDKLADLTASLDLSFRPNPTTKMVEIFINNKPLAHDIRNETVGSYASKVAVFPKVRAVLLDVQRAMGKSGVVADGRDMGTVVFADAHAKIFLTASAKSRADRRVLQLQNAGKSADYDTILADIRERDERDESRATAPSRPADDALVIDSSDLSADEVFEQVLGFCEAKGVVKK